MSKRPHHLGGAVNEPTTPSPSLPGAFSPGILCTPGQPDCLARGWPFARSQKCWCFWLLLLPICSCGLLEALPHFFQTKLFFR